MVGIITPSKRLSFERDYEDFRTFAIYAHGDQQYGPMPYAFHLASVENNLIFFGYKESHYRAAAWLHDVVEDTKITHDKVYQLFGAKVASMVWACTGEGLTRAERNASIIKKIQSFPEAAPVKVSDRLTNVLFGITQKSSQLNRYIDEQPAFSSWMKELMTIDKRSLQMWNYLEDTIEKAKAARHD